MSDLAELMLHQPLWWLVAALTLILAASIRLVTNHLWEEDEQPVLAHQANHTSHSKTGPELTIELYEQARKHRRHN